MGRETEGIPRDVRQALTAMRLQIDAETDRYAAAIREEVRVLRLMGRPKQAVARQLFAEFMEDNRGAYLHRHYRAHDEGEKWFEKVPDERYDAAMKEVMGNLQERTGEFIDDAGKVKMQELESRARVILAAVRETAGESRSILDTLTRDKLSGADVSALMRRKELGPALREWLGEEKTPLKNWAVTLGNVRRLSANQEMLNAVLDRGWGCTCGTSRISPPMPTPCPSAWIAAPAP